MDARAQVGPVPTVELEGRRYAPDPAPGDPAPGDPAPGDPAPGDPVDGDRPDGWRRRVLLEPRRPPAIAARPGAHWLALATVCIGAFMGQLDASVVTVVFPTMQRTFHASLGSVTWVGLSYLLVVVALVAAMGRLADMVGRKLLYTYGFVVFVVGSALCGLAPDLGALVGFRVLQAVGAAMLQANSVAIVVQAVPREKLGRGLGIQGAAQALGLALGPTLGGLLIDAGGWRLVFLVNVPAGVVGCVMARYLIPRSRHLRARVPLDWTGLALFVPAVGALLYAVSEGDSTGWSSPPILALLVVASVMAVAFVHRQRRVPSPVIDPRLFRRRSFSAGIAGGLLSYVVLFGTIFAVPFYLERGLHMSAGRSGLLLGVLPLALGLTTPLAGRLAERRGPRLLTVAGMATAATAAGALVTAPTTPVAIGLALACMGIGIGMFSAPNNAAVMSAVPNSQSGEASGILNMSRGLGTAFGLACTSLVFAELSGAALEGGSVTRGFQGAAALLAAVAVAGCALAAAPGMASACGQLVRRRARRPQERGQDAR